jgi:hypothetical protein
MEVVLRKSGEKLCEPRRRCFWDGWEDFRVSLQFHAAAGRRPALLFLSGNMRQRAIGNMPPGRQRSQGRRKWLIRLIPAHSGDVFLEINFGGYESLRAGQ